jgi:capsular exopolysaccharide synthesis family protein
MSRIYEALKQSVESKPCSIVELIEENRAHVNGMLPRQNRDVLRDPLGAAATVLQAESTGPGPVAAKSVDVPIRKEYQLVPMRTPAGVPVFPFDGTDSRSSEQYRILRTNILQHPLQPKVLAVSSATPGDGKTVTAINLAGILALRSEARVLIVDADLRRSSVAGTMGITSSLGLSGLLNGQCGLDEAILRIEQLPNLHVLPAGKTSLNPAELLDSAAFQSAVRSIREEFSFIILDTTPTAAVTDFKLVEQVCDGVLLVVRPQHTNRAAFLKTLDIQPQSKLLGIVMNDFQDWFLWKTHDSYGYYSEMSDEPAPSFWSRWRSR